MLSAIFIFFLPYNSLISFAHFSIGFRVDLLTVDSSLQIPHLTGHEVHMVEMRKWGEGCVIDIQSLLQGWGAETSRLAGLGAEVCACIFGKNNHSHQIMFPKDALRPLQLFFKKNTSYFEIIILSEDFEKTGWTERSCVPFTC